MQWQRDPSEIAKSIIRYSRSEGCFEEFLTFFYLLTPLFFIYTVETYSTDQFLEEDKKLIANRKGKIKKTKKTGLFLKTKIVNRVFRVMGSFLKWLLFPSLDKLVFAFFFPSWGFFCSVLQNIVPPKSRENFYSQEGRRLLEGEQPSNSELA